MTTNAERIRTALAGAERQVADFRRQLEKEQESKGVRFLPDHNLADAVLNLVMGATTRLAVMAPLRWNWRFLEQEILTAQKRGVEVALFCRDFEELPSMLHYNCDAIALGNALNARIAVSESAAIVGALNLWGPGMAQRIDAGVLITDKELRLDIDHFVQSLKDRNATQGKFA